MHSDRPVFRFAPSPNGLLHLGHAYSALLNHRMAKDAGARFLLRLEDIDRARCSLAFERQIEVDLGYLGLEWEGPPRRQSEHFADYSAALDALIDERLVYSAFLTRGDIRAFADRYEETEGAPWPRDPDGAPFYPGLDRALPETERRERMADGQPYTLRLDMERALARLETLSFAETGMSADGGAVEIAAAPEAWGDVVVARKDMPTSYHLAVVVDDALQGVTHVVRGRDLLPSTSVHRVLQALLGVPAPVYHHHALILAEDGRKLSKSAGDTSLAALRQAGMTAEDIRRMVAL